MKTPLTFPRFLSWLRLGLGLLLGLHVLTAGRALAQIPEVVFPADAGVINITQAPYFAKGDGKTDNTAALQQAINDYLKSGRILYFPKGIYLISNKLTYGSDLSRAKNLMLQGQSQAGTVIKLANGAAGYGSASSPKPLLTMFEGGSTGQAFRNTINDLTFDVGSGNPGAIGVEFMNNNQGGMENVTIRSSDATKRGATGLSFTRSWPGPAYFKNVTIEGFDYGIRATNYEYSLVFEHLTLQGQKVAGLRNTNQTFTIRDFRSVNTVPAIQQLEKAGQVSVLGGSFTGGSSANAAVTDNNGRLILRNVSSSGYGQLIDHSAGSGIADVAGPNAVEYYSHATNSLWPSPPRALSLAVEEAPQVAAAPLSEWVKVANGSGDDAASIQAAIDAAAAAGKTTVYFPKGTYNIGKTIRVHGSVQRLCGVESTLEVVEPLRKSTGTVFRFEDLTGNAVVVERFRWAPYGNEIPAPWTGGKFTWLEHASPATLVVEHVTAFSGNAYKASGAGKVFVNDAAISGWTFNAGQQVWLRQINPESNSTMIANNGATLWVLGVKTEGWGTVISTTSGGKTEVVGGLLYPVRSDYERKYPAFVVDNASASLTFTHTGNERYEVYVQETRGSETRQLLEAQAGNGRNIVLFSAHTGTAPPAPAPVEYIVDNQDAGFNTTGTWTASTGLQGYHGSNYLHDGDAQASAADVATWTSPITTARAGTYDVYMRWTKAADRPDAAPVEVNYQGGVASLKLNQSVGGGEWVKIGTWPFTGGSGDYVRITGADAGYTIADAVKWVKVSGEATGRAAESAVVAAEPPALPSGPIVESSLVAYPNPSPDGRSTLALQVRQAQRVNVYVHNAQGRLVSMFSVSCQPGRNDFRLPAPLPPGTYYLRATPDGTPHYFTLDVQ
ncbi:glycosyl hydrolase family 28-related protein [Hymenobacter weizhouensis]|uniref:glycosyl hydrolase family 28-related protein n=1 Tax=Hymenobacter sp. YIM 151500-1 TaxID=2987689 RepID=UPI002226AD5C|nr:glycosyl hydrolase family 28-related protein [Hymenobacter sp. YIM 151500-1]UYZ62045.1 T9SS type A sorting domain-containing protein [Hymenobacter sp. YIM 151500-1]